MKRLLPLMAIFLAGQASAANPTVTVALGGDVMFGRITSDGWRSHPAPELAEWRDALHGADIALVNLETGICDQGRQRSVLPLLWAPAERLDALVEAGVDVVNVANNHALDCGPHGVDQTLTALSSRRIAAAGVAEDGVVVVTDDVVVVGATMHPPPYRSAGRRVLVTTDARSAIEHVRSARAAHPDKLLIVSLHWGRERTTQPAAWQRDLAHALVDVGANAVAGHGSHTPQPTEHYRGAPIMFSLGNLVFDDRSAVGRVRPPQQVTFRSTAGVWAAQL